MTTARLSLKVRLLKAEVTETLLYGCVTWTLNAAHYDEIAPRNPPASPPASCGPHQPLVHQGPQEDEIREHRNDHVETAARLRWGNITAKQGATTRSNHVCADGRWRKPGTRCATQLAQNPERRPRRFSIHRRFQGRVL